nr:hypothetical protein CFP56_11605 [Quercus suber]
MTDIVCIDRKIWKQRRSRTRYQARRLVDSGEVNGGLGKHEAAARSQTELPYRFRVRLQGEPLLGHRFVRRKDHGYGAYRYQLILLGRLELHDAVTRQIFIRILVIL